MAALSSQRVRREIPRHNAVLRMFLGPEPKVPTARTLLPAELRSELREHAKI